MNNIMPPHPSLAPCIMILGTSSGAGKSWLATALCRWYARRGYRVAPFKAQNMSNNARVVAGTDGQWGEMGSAQYFQALAARAAPDVRMNPLLLKPEADTRSQVVLLGQARADLSALPWRSRSTQVWPAITTALDALRATHDLVVIEGAGSPAEINLSSSDIVNMRIARHARARCLLVTDIDRGGAFAHLYGTWALLPAADQALLRGFVLNKFRGDAQLLHPAPEQLQQRTGIPTVAVLPMLHQHGLPEEDSMFDSAPSGALAPHMPSHHLAIVAWPHISNLDEFQPLKNIPGLHLRWVRHVHDLHGADTIILPGSKSTVADLAWLRQQGLDAAIVHHAHAGGRVLGICGGLQILGEALVDPDGVESDGLGANAPGLGLLPLVTCFAKEKIVQPSIMQFPFIGKGKQEDTHQNKRNADWSALSHLRVQGYEIHMGRTLPHPAMLAAGAQVCEAVPGLLWHNPAGNVLGLYLHGLFENPCVLHALFGQQAPVLDDVFERLADVADQAFDSRFLLQLLQADTPPAHSHMPCPGTSTSA